MHADGGKEVGIRRRHDRGHGSARRQPGHVNSVGIDVILTHNLLGDPNDQGRFASTMLLVGSLEPILR